MAPSLAGLLIHTMLFNNSQHTNASRSIFTDVNIGHDHIVIKEQINLNGVVFISNSESVLPPECIQHNFNNKLLYLSGAEPYSRTRVLSGTTPFARPQPIVLLDSSDHRSSLSNPETATVSQLTSAYCSQINPACDIAESLVVKIVELLMQSGHYRDLGQELHSLQKILILTRLAIRTFERVPLGQTVTSFIHQEVMGCNVVLQVLLGKIKGYQRDLSSTPIRFFWSQVLLSGGDVECLRKKLSVHQKSLGQCLMALKL